MGWIDWLVVVIPVSFVLGMAFYSRKYIRGVADFLSAGRLCGRYVISVGDIANALSIIALVAYVEVHYKTGFALAFWSKIGVYMSVIMGLLGYCTYRFRETKAMSLGQFLEMRYNRKLRIFAASLRSLSEMLANMIMPAIAARFFIYFFDLPQTIQIGAISIPTFILLVVVCLTVAVTIICMGGTLALVITDAIQGMICFPLIAIFVIFILYQFSWFNEIVPVMMDRVQGESFLNPYDVSKMRDFNIFFVFVLILNRVIHRASWLGGGATTAAKNPHEQKMAGMLGAWRSSITTIFYILIAVSIITLLNHRNWAPEAKNIRDKLSSRISRELITNDANRKEFNARIKALPIQKHQIGVDKALSQKANLDTPLLNTAHTALKEFEGETAGNAKFQEFRTLFHQMMLGQSMRQLLPPVLLGLFCLIMVLAMISTDDSRMYSAAITITQDIIMPLKKKELTTKQHVWTLRIVTIGVGVFFLCGSFFMAQLDYIQLFITLMCAMWLGGCGPVMIFGLYGRFGTTAGAFTSLISGMLMSLGFIFVKRNWADYVYPWIKEANLVEPLNKLLISASGPFEPFISWKMDAVKFPINSMEITFITMISTIFLYCVVSYFTMKEPFNIERMLHRGKYNLDHNKKERLKWSLSTVFSKLIGITKEYTTMDKLIAWSLFTYSIVWGFFITFLLVFIWNAFTPWPIEWWSNYFFVVYLIIPGIMAAISTVWFGIGGFIDLRRLFRDLKARVDNPLDNGQVDGHVSLADKKLFEEIEEHEPEDKSENK